MPIHDWTKVGADSFHHFHSLWIAELSNVLNSGLLPQSYYAMVEQHAGASIADVLTLERIEPAAARRPHVQVDGEGGVALLEAPPKVTVKEKAGPLSYTDLRRTLSVRHVSDDTVVAMIEILSPGNKASHDKLKDFVEKACEALRSSIHLLIVDLFPPGSFDLHGIHGELHRELGLETEEGDWPVPGKPLTLAAYDASVPCAYVEPVAVGDAMIEMPLFLKPKRYINVPLEQTYMAAYRGVPRHLKPVLES